MAEQDRKPVLSDGDKKPITVFHDQLGANTTSMAQLVSTLQDYDPIIPDVVTAHYLNKSGFEAVDPRLVRLVSLSTHKFISDIVNDSLQQFKMRQSAVNKKQRQDKKTTLTVEDLTPALAEYGITLRKPPYFT
ncbi:transcription initiation factor TFIID subunit 10-like [Watersipora subatra]|uniref:transcription initiation factor TFIID subunit 10-like n=1 Tax=Watersipora subatra TaxID=2589382 RepID=UPI00355BA93F